MMNYIWIGLIVAAIAYGAFRDIKGDPTMEHPQPEVVYTQPEESDEGLVLDYDFTANDEAELTLNLSLASDAGDPNELSVPIRGNAGNHLIVAEVTDADGDEFLSPLGLRFDESEEWTQGKFLLDDMVPTPANPAASIDHPLELTGISIRKSQSSSILSGSVEMGDIKVLFPEVLYVSEELKSKTWMGVLTKSSARWAGISIELVLELIGIMMFWLGLMRIAEAAGLVQALARLLKPIMTRLFPNIPPEGEAMGAIIMNMSANMLGLGNAATPLGLKAMEELQELNEHKEYASNAMCMLLSVNTSSVTIITPAIIGYRFAAGSENLMIFWPVLIMSTTISTACAITACKLLEKMPYFQIPTKLQKELNNNA